MAGSVFGNLFKVSTFGESHGEGLGVIVDGCPAGLKIDSEYIQKDMDRRRPGSNKFGTKRNEGDKVRILSGVFEGVTEGTPIAMVVFNENQKSKDYSAIMDVFRPGHADMGFWEKYGIRDYRGGGRSSGRETLSRVASGAVARRFLEELGIQVKAYVTEIAGVKAEKRDFDEVSKNPLFMPDKEAAEAAAEEIEKAMQSKDSVGGVIECRISGMPIGVGEPVFDKLDASLAKAVMSIGAVKGVEFGAGFGAATLLGSENNDGMRMKDGKITKLTNNSGGVLGGFSDGDDVVFRAAFKPTPSIARLQQSVTRFKEDTDITVNGRHDPSVVPRAVVVVEAMAALTVADLMLMNMSARMDNVIKIYKEK